MSYIISGIQQVGIGNPNVNEAFAWYRKNFGMDIPMLNEDSVADQMLPYTGNKGHQRHAILAINLKGGGGFEIWQYKSRTPEAAKFTVEVGDLGFTIAKMKTEDVDKTYARLKANGVNIITPITVGPDGKKHFYVKDLYGNMFEIVDFNDFFHKGMLEQGGPCGMVIGVSDIERSKKFYADILGYDTVVFDKEEVFADWNGIEGSGNKARRVLLKHSKPRAGSFSNLLGSSIIELVQYKEKAGRKIFENRYWGDLGFIHFCFDIKDMQSLKKHCAACGHPFTVESNPDFDMGEAAGQFAYIEDPDGALIELVETHKIPILKKVGWYLNLDKRDPQKPLPNWMLKTLRFSRVKD
ncbi:MAG: VOC family protein [Bacteroidota bacterium]|nr:VOC family protein [Bacteroidota bacterium]